MVSHSLPPDPYPFSCLQPCQNEVFLVNEFLFYEFYLITAMSTFVTVIFVANSFLCPHHFCHLCFFCYCPLPLCLCMYSTSGYYCPLASTSRTMYPCPAGRFGKEGATNAACTGPCDQGPTSPSCTCHTPSLYISTSLRISISISTPTCVSTLSYFESIKTLHLYIILTLTQHSLTSLPISRILLCSRLPYPPTISLRWRESVLSSRQQLSSQRLIESLLYRGISLD